MFLGSIALVQIARLALSLRRPVTGLHFPYLWRTVRFYEVAAFPRFLTTQSMRATKRKQVSSFEKSQLREIECKAKISRSFGCNSDLQHQNLIVGKECTTDVADTHTNDTHSVNRFASSEVNLEVQNPEQLFHVVPRILKSKNLLRSHDKPCLNFENQRLLIGQPFFSLFGAFGGC